MMNCILAVTAGEAYNSKTCRKCSCEGEIQVLFACSSCGEYNADLNGTINIAKKFGRSLGNMPLDGAAYEPALNSAKMEKQFNSAGG